MPSEDVDKDEIEREKKNIQGGGGGEERGRRLAVGWVN